jgi:hypothetical protein
MSDNWILIIPEDPHFVPDEARQQSATAYFSSIAPGADEVLVSVWDAVQFVDCGGNCESISCPSCHKVIDARQWQAWMDSDFDGGGFILVPHKMPCCGASLTLSELRYEWVQGFARCQVSALNPDIGKLSDQQVRGFERLLGCPIRVVYRHL